jgi:hypothetical protein
VLKIGEVVRLLWMMDKKKFIWPDLEANTERRHEMKEPDKKWL